MALFTDLEIWIDLETRSGAENMAVDEIIHFSGRNIPLLRIYRWSNPVVTFGYFEKLSDAKRAFPSDNIEYVRRCTGGGIVDHRTDLTYTLNIPRDHRFSLLRGAESYKLIHKAVLASLSVDGLECHLSDGELPLNTRTCFMQPVLHDIVGADGQKLAGAGQKRSRAGLLHQGSVKRVVPRDAWQSHLIKNMTSNPMMVTLRNIDGVPAVVGERYGNPNWTNKRA